MITMTNISKWIKKKYQALSNLFLVHKKKVVETKLNAHVGCPSPNMNCMLPISLMKLIDSSQYSV